MLVLWQVLSDSGTINPLLASSPIEIVRAAWEMIENGTLLPAIASTARLFAIAFGLSIITGLVVGVIIGWYGRVDAVIDPWISILYATPRIAFIPMVMVWIGLNLTAQIVIVWMIAFFPIVINVSAGIRSIDRDHLRVARSFLATNGDVLRTVALPASVPFVMAGIRHGMIQGLIGVVVAEFFIGITGVGGLIFTAGQMLQTGRAFVGAAAFALTALVLSSLLRMIERRIDRWR